MHTGTAIVEASAKVDREGQGDRRPRARGAPSPTSNSSAAASPSSAPTVRSRSWNWRRQLRGGTRTCRRTRRSRSTSPTSATDRPHRLIPTAVTSPKSRSIRKPASSIVDQIRLRQRFRHCHQSDDRRRPAPRRRGAGHRPGADGTAVYDKEGQLLTGSFMDYAMPRAADVPMFRLADHPVPAKTNPLGVKGCGEAGCAGALTSVMNAVIDALGEHGIRHRRHAVDPVPHLAGAARGRRPARRLSRRNDASRFRPHDPARQSRLIAAGVRRAFHEPLLYAAAGAAVRVRARRFQESATPNWRWR